MKSDRIVTNIPTHLDLQTKSPNNWAISNVRKIFDLKDGRLLGIMVISIDIDFITKVNDRLDKERRSTFTIVDEVGKVIYNSNYEKIGKPFTSVLPIDLNQRVLKAGG